MEELYWIILMDGGGHLAVCGAKKPGGERVQCGKFSIEADRYHVVYGPCSRQDAIDYMNDMGGITEYRL